MVGYRSLNTYLRETFGEKLYKLALDGGFSCPNRDGTIGTEGCSFCLAGSGDFAEPVFPGRQRPCGGEDLTEEDCRRAVALAITRAEDRVKRKFRGRRYIVYFQSYTGTYGSPAQLKRLYSAAIRDERTAILSIGTRPDCLDEEIVALLRDLNRIKPVWVELGLQTIHEETAAAIRRGYPLPVFDRAMRALKAAGLYVVVHMIVGLPGESPAMMRETAAYIGRSGADGIKLQLLQVLRGTDMAGRWEAGELSLPPTPEAYAALLEELVAVLPETVTVHRLTGDGAKSELLAPAWSADKKRVLQALAARLRPDATRSAEDSSAAETAS